jgi:glucose/arabinose dehydrogenase
VYAAYVTSMRERQVLEIRRLRESGGVLGEAAVIGSFEVSSNEISTSMRFGPDGLLYLGVGTGADQGAAQNVADTAGKILRLRDDGSTPDDNPWRSPVLSVGHHDPRGLAWQPQSRTLWEVERDESGDELNVIRSGGNYGWPVVRPEQSHPGVTSATIVLPAGTQPSGATTITVSGSPMYGDLIVSAVGAQDLLRIRFTAASQRRPLGRLLQGRYGHIAQVTSAVDGALYFVTANSDTWGAGHDLLVRLTPTSR